MSETNDTDSLKLIAAFAAIYIIWGSTYLAIRFAIESLPPFLMAGIRFLIAGGVLYLYAGFKKSFKVEVVHLRDALIIGGLLLLGGNGGVVWAEQYVPSGLTALLVATVPVWIVTLEWLRPEGVKPTGKVTFGIILGFIGLFIMINPSNFIGGGSINLFGAGALLIATFSWSVGSIYSRKANLPKSKLLSVALQMLAGGLLLSLLSMLLGEWKALQINLISEKSLLALAYLIVFGALIGYTAYIWLLDVAGPSRTSTYAYINPVIAVFLGWLLAGEEINFRVALSTIIIVLAVVIIISRKNIFSFFPIKKKLFSSMNRRRVKENDGKQTTS